MLNCLNNCISQTLCEQQRPIRALPSHPRRFSDFPQNPTSIVPTVPSAPSARPTRSAPSPLATSARWPCASCRRCRSLSSGSRECSPICGSWGRVCSSPVGTPALPEPPSRWRPGRAGRARISWLFRGEGESSWYSGSSPDQSTCFRHAFPEWLSPSAALPARQDGVWRLTCRLSPVILQWVAGTGGGRIDPKYQWYQFQVG